MSLLSVILNGYIGLRFSDDILLNELSFRYNKLSSFVFNILLLTLIVSVVVNLFVVKLFVLILLADNLLFTIISLLSVILNGYIVSNGISPLFIFNNVSS